MTCIAGVRHNGKIYLGGDSAGTDGALNITTRLDTKVFKVDDMVIGYTSSFRMGQLLRYLDLPKHPKGLDDFGYMVTKMVPLIRKTFKDGGYNKKENDRDEGGIFLVGYRGHLYCIEGDYQVGEAVDDYEAVGCGGAYACGALAINGSLSPKERITQALQVAVHHSAGVRGPFNFVNT